MNERIETNGKARRRSVLERAATELDGENAHYVRLVVLELETGRALLVVRRQVDPTWVSPNRRSLYARELDGCKLALEVRDAVQGSPGATEALSTAKDPG